MQEKILIVDDEQLIRWSLSEAVRGWGFTPAEAESVKSAIEAFETHVPVVTLLDINLPDGSGLDLLREIRRRQPDAIVIMITANVLADDTIAALRAGAYDFITKPINLEEISVAINNGLEARELRREIKQIRRAQSDAFNFSQIVGDSEAIKETIALAKKVAASDVTSVLLQGESGTGKDLIARAIHFASARRSGKPFVAINCAAIPATLLESELFGYEKGAFTDAKQKKEGLFEQAEGGSLFLDEIGELELGLQAKLLRVLEEGLFRRVGGLRDIPLDVRVIAASNKNLRAESDEGRFRLDLYYRLSIIQIDIPPLRSRGEDIILLAYHFIKNSGAGKSGTPVSTLSPEAAKAFLRYPWKGNVRELKNAVERSLILEDGDTITTKYLPREISGPAGAESEHQPNGYDFYLPPEGLKLDEFERSIIRQALARTGGNVTRAGELLHISRDRMRYALKKEKVGRSSQQTQNSEENN